MAPSEARRRSRRSRVAGQHGAVRYPSAAYRYNAVYAGRAAEPNAQVTTTQLAGVQQQPAESEHEDFKLLIEAAPSYSRSFPTKADKRASSLTSTFPRTTDS
ncbi:uncharacterized protein TrAtP1_005735 [Trichoderma atroviride]|uniref:uncharacterized protein n=1 Tax=Hypocrea atroviridis TaxID=63577 RepID=UPI003328ED36|nr:hypothetical protein TrAtP1_005735 [Trichoderma atroviride]